MYQNNETRQNMLLDILAEQRGTITYLREENARLRAELEEARDAELRRVC